MNERERALVFESAMEDYRAGLHSVAARTLDQLVEDGSVDPLHLSYCGLLKAMTEGGAEISIELCRRAVAAAGDHDGALYLNLARVLTASGRRREAIEALDQATSRHPRDPRLRQELRHLVPRARPMFRSLSRSHPLNKYLGIARTVGGRLWVTFVPRVTRVAPSGAQKNNVRSLRERSEHGSYGPGRPREKRGQRANDE
jgi:predicted Zn-dependent protease